MIQVKPVYLNVDEIAHFVSFRYNAPTVQTVLIQSSITTLNKAEVVFHFKGAFGCICITCSFFPQLDKLLYSLTYPLSQTFVHLG